MNDAKVEVLAISYPWLTKEHPDPDGWHLKIVQHFLRLYFTWRARASTRTTRSACCRRRRGEARRDLPGSAQTASFTRALKNMERWYANAERWPVWRLTAVPPNTFTYEHRGWCFFEQCVSEMITPGDRVLDLGLAVDDDGACFDERRFFQQLGKRSAGCAAAGWRRRTTRTARSVDRRQDVQRAAEVPDQPGGVWRRARVFTNGADALFVKRKYAETFQQVVAEATELNLANLYLAQPLSELAPALDVCGSRLRALDLSGNKRVSGGLGACAILSSLKLGGCEGLSGGLEPLRGLERLTYLLDLQHEGMSGGLEPLRGLTLLTHLDLQHCKGLSGDVEPLGGLARLARLELGWCTRLAGDVAPLRGLVQVTRLTLEGCPGLTGDEGAERVGRGEAEGVRRAVEPRGELREPGSRVSWD